MITLSRCKHRGGDAMGRRPLPGRNTAQRNAAGSMLVLTVCIVALLFLPLLIFATTVGPYFLSSERTQGIVEAASNVAATDLSRIVIEDPTFGYVSLSNHESVGKATVAADGEPVPVIGINTLTGTLRQNAIIADELNNVAMQSFVEMDLLALNNANRALNQILSESITGDPMRKPARDINGAIVRPYQDVEQFLSQNLPPNVRITSLKLSLGWLENGCGTTVPIPQPASLAKVPKKDMASGKYTAFVDYPVGQRKFSFAGLGSQTHLVSASEFRLDDGKHLSSIVRVECTLMTTDRSAKPIICVACCQPFSAPDKALAGAMTVRVCGRAVPGLSSWREFLSGGSFYDAQVTSFDVSGDYPIEKKSRLDLVSERHHASTADEFAHNLYCWLRNGRLRPRLDAVVAMVNEPFSNDLNQVYCYEFASDGSISRRAFDGNHVARAVVSDAQPVMMSDTRMRSGANAIIFFRDSVSCLGPDGGQHAGQPLAGYPLGAVSGTFDYEEIAARFAKRSEFSSGLAVDIEIGGTHASTAANDVVSMRRRTANRSI
jgi:hypothetical protein